MVNHNNPFGKGGQWTWPEHVFEPELWAHRKRAEKSAQMRAFWAEKKALQVRSSRVSSVTDSSDGVSGGAHAERGNEKVRKSSSGSRLPSLPETLEPGTTVSETKFPGQSSVGTQPDPLTSLPFPPRNPRTPSLPKPQ